MSGVLAGNSCRTCMERRMVTALQNSGEWVSQPDQTIKCALEPKKQRSFLFSSVSCWASWSPQGLIGKTERCSDMLGSHESSLWVEPWVLPMNKVGFVWWWKRVHRYVGEENQWWYKLLTVHPNLRFFHHEEINWRQTAQWATAQAPQVGRGIQQWLLHPRQEVFLPHGTPCLHGSHSGGLAWTLLAKEKSDMAPRKWVKGKWVQGWVNSLAEVRRTHRCTHTCVLVHACVWVVLCR